MKVRPSPLIVIAGTKRVHRLDGLVSDSTPRGRARRAAFRFGVFIYRRRSSAAPPAAHERSRAGQSGRCCAAGRGGNAIFHDRLAFVGVPKDGEGPKRGAA